MGLANTIRNVAGRLAGRVNPMGWRAGPGSGPDTPGRNGAGTPDSRGVSARIRSILTRR